MNDPLCLRCGKPRSRHNYFAGWGSLCHNGSGVFSAQADVIARASTAELKAELARRDSDRDRVADETRSGSVPEGDRARGRRHRPKEVTVTKPIPQDNTELIVRLRRTERGRNERFQCVVDPALLIEAADALESLKASSPLLSGDRITADWSLRMAEQEGDAEIGAGAPDHPLRRPLLLEEELVEVVAKALYDCDEDGVDSRLDSVEPVMAEVLREAFNLREPFEQIHPETQQAYRDRARAALSASRSHIETEVIELRKALEKNIGTMSEQVRRCQRWGKSHHELDTAIEETRNLLPSRPDCGGEHG